MEKFTVLSVKEIRALSPEEIKKYYKKYKDYLNGELKINLRDKAEIEKAEKNKNKSRLNHAMLANFSSLNLPFHSLRSLHQRQDSQRVILTI